MKNPESKTQVIYSVYDHKTEEHSAISSAASRAFIIRDIQGTFKTQPNHPFVIFTKDFALAIHGEFDINTGEINLFERLEIIEFTAILKDSEY